MDRIIEVFTPAAMARWPRADNTSQVPVFVVGMPRSGSTLVEQILDRHSEVFGAGELKDIAHSIPRLPGLLGTDQGFPDCMPEFTAEAASALAWPYLYQLQELAPEAARVINKMPYNFLHLGLIRLLFPQARIIHTTRDPRATGLSCYFQNFAQRHDWAYDLHNIGFYYRQYHRLMEHWRDTAGIPMLEVRYEDLVSDPEPTIHQLVDYLGLAWQPACLNPEKAQRVVRTASHQQVRQPIYGHASQHWQHYAAYLKPLKEALGPLWPSQDE